MLIDTHIHLDAAEFDGSRDSVLIDARAAGVGAFVVPAVDRESFHRVTALAAANRDIYPALGIHPLFTAAATQDDLEVLEHELGRTKCVAVGEIGLQLCIAQRFQLPVILHLRRAQDAVLKQLRQHAVCGGIAHAFNGSRQQADAFIKLGFKLGFGGAMSFEGSQRIRRLATELPLDSIVLETDAPDMAPAWGQGRSNVPANIARYARILAELRGLPVEEVIRATGANARTALPGLGASSATP
jgi:TatD DNase family protein